MQGRPSGKDEGTLSINLHENLISACFSEGYLRIEKRMTAPDYSDNEIRNLVLRALADQQPVPAQNSRPKRATAGSAVGRELSSTRS